jgi:hypothetical protein
MRGSDYAQEPGMKFRCPRFAVLLTILTAAAASAAEIDPATPAGALKSFYEALERSDARAVRNLLHATTDAERQLAEAFAAQITAAKALGDAASKKYGATGDALSRGMPARDQIAQLQSAAVTTEGDTATLKLPGQEKPLRLKNVSGNWKVIVADYAGHDLPGQTAVMKEMAAAFTTVAADINADKLPTPQDAQRVLQQKLQAVLFNTLTKHAPPTTTRPTTKPAPR